ncbi:hypothetical protein KI387_008819 [Taxus chinensis]|uniref:Luc7-like protein 3 n=1 Tax=Taxus chinensis TaxID=29808 RepID=A0AA38CQ50_TAXCH|nr:hypothetical protein KI387_008819 [Taxus chinensis]
MQDIAGLSQVLSYPTNLIPHLSCSRVCSPSQTMEYKDPSDKARNLTEEEKKGYREIRWDDREVCGFYMVRFCPHDLFVNTKSDLGPCPRMHDLKLKESFEKSSRHDLYVPRFEAELAQFCEKLVQDLDRKVRRGRERLAQDVDISSMMPISTEKSEQLATIEEKIRKLLEQVENLGEEGKVDEAQALMRKVDILNVEKTVVTQAASSERGLILSQEKKMALCEICGSFLVANDAAERTQSHVTGKQHIGYGMVRDFITEFKAKKDKVREDERLAREKEAEERRNQREKEMGRTKDNDWDMEGNRVREDRDRYRERDRERDRTREQRERARDRDRNLFRSGRGGRERERERDRERDRNGDRERSRDKDHVRSRSRSPYRHASPGRHFR